MNNFGLTVHDVNRIGLTRTSHLGNFLSQIKNFYKSRIFFFADHHEAHAAVGYFSSPFKKSIIMTMDGGGNDGGLGFGLVRIIKLKKLKPKVMDPLDKLGLL